MDAADSAERKKRLRLALEQDAFVKGEEVPHVTRRGKLREAGWLFDLRAILSRADVLDDLAALFWEQFGGEETQIGTIETAGIPIMTALVAHGKTYGAQKHANGFYIRKSRKRDGLLKMIEGEVVGGKRIVLVDDLTKSGQGLMRQVEVVESLGMKVDAVWVLIRFRDADYFEYFNAKGIPIYSLFELNDFAETLGTRNLPRKVLPPPPAQAFDIKWKFSSPNPSYQYVVPKSDPILDTERVYLGSDIGVFYALEQEDGSLVWSYKVGFHPKGKGIFSSPALHNGTIFFGAYDGSVYALDSQTGKKRWIFMEADWVGSSPAVAHDLGIVFIGLEFGLWRKRGGIVALDAATGKKIWQFKEMPCFTHSSPLYIAAHRQVIIGSNDGAAYLFDAKTGSLIWKFETGALSEKELDTGFSARDIKESFAYDAKRDIIIFGNSAATLFAVDRKSGTEVHRFQAEFGFYSTPLIVGDTVVASSIDKRLYCLDLDTFQEHWQWNAGARIFASPVLIDGVIYIGSNTGRLTMLDQSSGAERASMTFTERITNRPAYNPKTKRLFVQTFANELYCVQKKEAMSDKSDIA